MPACHLKACNRAVSADNGVQNYGALCPRLQRKTWILRLYLVNQKPFDHPL